MCQQDNYNNKVFEYNKSRNYDATEILIAILLFIGLFASSIIWLKIMIGTTSAYLIIKNIG